MKPLINLIELESWNFIGAGSTQAHGTRRHAHTHEGGAFLLAFQLEGATDRLVNMQQPSAAMDSWVDAEMITPGKMCSLPGCTGTCLCPKAKDETKKKNNNQKSRQNNNKRQSRE